MIWLGMWLGGIVLTAAMCVHAFLEEPSGDLGGWWSTTWMAVIWPGLAVWVFGKWAWSTVRK